MARPQTLIHVFMLRSPQFAPVHAQIRARLPGVANWIEVSDGEVAPFAERFDDLVAEGDGAPLDIARSGDDEFFIYTGGTTGMPKGVVWTHQAMREITLSAARKLGPVPETYDQLREAVRLAPPPSVLPL